MKIAEHIGWDIIKNAVTRSIVRIERLEWKTKVLALIVAFAALMFIVGPVQFLFRDTVQLQAESLDRGRALVRLLAASNQEAFSQNQEVLYSTDAVRGEVGVLDAYVTDADGAIVSPAEYFGKRASDIEELSGASGTTLGADIAVRNRGGGSYILEYPIRVMTETYKGLKAVTKGRAFVLFDARSGLNRMGYQFLEAIKFSLLLVLVAWGAFALLKRWTLTPIRYAAEGVPEHEDGIAAGGHITFSELKPLLESKGRDAPKARRKTMKQPATAAAGLRERLSSLVQEPMIILNGKKEIAMTQAAMQKLLGCTLAEGEHLLEALSESPYFGDVMQLVVDVEEGNKDCSRRSADGSLAFSGTSVVSEGERYIAFTVNTYE